MTPPVKSGPRYNNLITVEKVRVIDDDGAGVGFAGFGIDHGFERFFGACGDHFGEA
jgi:hypothetical protein